MSENNAIVLLAKYLQIDDLADPGRTDEERLELLAEYIDHLIQTDFNRLLSILYRVDVSEEKLKKELAESNSSGNSGRIIAELLVNREVEKIKFREEYRKKRPGWHDDPE